MKTKKIPAIVMLLGGSVACIITYLNGYNLKDMLVTLVWVLILFFVFGVVIEFLFEKFEIESKEEPESDDGEVVEKTSENHDEEDGLVTETENGQNPGEMNNQ